MRRAGRSAINESLYEKLLDAVNSLAHETRAFDREIALAGEVLRIAQPPKPGKIDIRWWKVDRKDLVQPVLVRWNKLRARWIVRPWSFRKTGVSRDGTSALNADAVERIGPLVVQAISMVKERHAQIEKIIREAQRETNVLMLHRSNLHSLLELELAGIVARLLEKGYVVESKYRNRLNALRPDWTGPDEDDIV